MTTSTPPEDTTGGGAHVGYVRRAIGTSVVAGRYTRVVDRLHIHGKALEFQALAEQVVAPNTRYLVLDLDRTLHLGRNMGELLGFEICAHLAYGNKRKTQQEGRWALDASDIPGTIRYGILGAQMWAFPGLFYLFWGKLSRLSNLTRRLTFRRFGPEPVRRVQLIPQTNLLHQLANFPLDDLRKLARDVWNRHIEDQVIERKDLDWLRERCPNLKIILTSASPQPVVEVAAEMLGIDEVDYTHVNTPEQFAAGGLDATTEERLAAPFGPGWVARRAARPWRVAPPSHVHINSSYAKIDRLISRHPDMLDPSVITVGITDTGYGEDHCWGEYFTKVVDVNSNAPFAPLVSVSSPLQEIHSAHVLSRKERTMQAGFPGYLDPRRSPTPPAFDRILTHTSMEQSLSDVIAKIEAAAKSYAQSEQAIGAARAELELQDASLRAQVDVLVEQYNISTSNIQAPGLLAELDAAAQQFSSLAKRLAKVERPVSEAAFLVTTLLETARKLA